MVTIARIAALGSGMIHGIQIFPSPGVDMGSPNRPRAREPSDRLPLSSAGCPQVPQLAIRASTVLGIVSSSSPNDLLHISFSRRQSPGCGPQIVCGK